MKSDHIFRCGNMAKNDIFCVVFSVVCVVLQQKLNKKIALTVVKNMCVNAVFAYLTYEK